MMPGTIMTTTGMVRLTELSEHKACGSYCWHTRADARDAMQHRSDVFVYSNLHRYNEELELARQGCHVPHAFSLSAQISCSALASQ